MKKIQFTSMNKENPEIPTTFNPDPRRRVHWRNMRCAKSVAYLSLSAFVMSGRAVASAAATASPPVGVQLTVTSEHSEWSILSPRKTCHPTGKVKWKGRREHFVERLVGTAHLPRRRPERQPQGSGAVPLPTPDACAECTYPRAVGLPK
uniref:Uncharacterized protein n=2 Tax=Oryza TaxID=4527 RepID=A0A0E0EC75_9ORYZ